MLINQMFKLFIFAIFINLFLSLNIQASNQDFNLWIKDFKLRALEYGVSESVFNEVMLNAKFLPRVIEFDRFQPEFYEDTFTYINKRSSKKKVNQGLKIYKKEKEIINKVEKEFKVEKELLLALMGIETNFGKYLGKMDIVSSLATLSFDKRRSEFFSKELLILLKLVENKIIDKDVLFGSWAGAFGNFQFMPRTIKNYAIDYNKNTTIELKKTEDSFASAANYLKKIGWQMGKPCFYKVELKKNTPDKLLNTSARNIKNKKKLSFYKRYILDFEKLNVQNDIKVALITPDKDIIPGSKKLSPAYLVFDNYEKILHWNRSLRFALAVCTLKENIKNEI